MTQPNINAKVSQAVKELLRIHNRVIPVKVGSEVVKSIRGNFRKSGFYGQQWQTTKRQQVPFKGAPGKYKPLLSSSTHLMSSTDYIPGVGRVIIRNTTPYAKVHNEGASIGVTTRMKGFFWAKHYESKGGKGKKSETPESEFWKHLALKKTGSKIRIPKRQFMGPSPEVERIVSKVIDKEFYNFTKNFR